MVGPAYAVDSKYFGEIGAYDEGMKIWGGENLEFPWRVIIYWKQCHIFVHFTIFECTVKESGAGDVTKG